jgi:hypothetical protein
VAVAAAGQLTALQEKLRQRDADVSVLQRQAALMQAQLREAQRAGQAAAEAQAAAGKALDGQAAELAALRQQLKEAEVSGAGCWALQLLSQSQTADECTSVCCGVGSATKQLRLSACPQRALTPLSRKCGSVAAWQL